MKVHARLLKTHDIAMLAMLLSLFTGPRLIHTVSLALAYLAATHYYSKNDLRTTNIVGAFAVMVAVQHLDVFATGSWESNLFSYTITASITTFLAAQAAFILNKKNSIRQQLTVRLIVIGIIIFLTLSLGTAGLTVLWGLFAAYAAMVAAIWENEGSWPEFSVLTGLYFIALLLVSGTYYIRLFFYVMWFVASRFILVVGAIIVFMFGWVVNIIARLIARIDPPEPQTEVDFGEMVQDAWDPNTILGWPSWINMVLVVVAALLLLWLVVYIVKRLAVVRSEMDTVPLFREKIEHGSKQREVTTAAVDVKYQDQLPANNQTVCVLFSTYLGAIMEAPQQIYSLKELQRQLPEHGSNIMALFQRARYSYKEIDLEAVASMRDYLKM